VGIALLILSAMFQWLLWQPVVEMFNAGSWQAVPARIVSIEKVKAKLLGPTGSAGG
jgi:hypothetical protein